MSTNHYDINFNSITRGSGNGNRDATLNNIIRGKNWLGGSPNLHIIKEHSGLVFIAPPDLNLAPTNVGHVREFAPLLTKESYSLGATIRDMLDPRTALSQLDSSTGANSKLRNPKYPFLSLLDNTLLTLSGWPDYVMEEYVSNPGKAGSTILTASGRIKKNQHFSLNATHMNLPGDAINQIYTYLALWMDHVHRWSVSPHFTNIRNNRLDYAMRIYRFAFDGSGTRVNQFTMTGYGFPIAGSQGAVMDYDSSNSVNQGYDTISASWSNVGCFHNDPIVIVCFNKLVERFNSDMVDGTREKKLIKVGAETSNGWTNSLASINKFQYHGYPRINPYTLEFEVWVEKEIYDYLNKGVISDEIMDEIAKNSQANFSSAYANLSWAEKQALNIEA